MLRVFHFWEFATDSCLKAERKQIAKQELDAKYIISKFAARLLAFRFNR